MAIFNRVWRIGEYAPAAGEPGLTKGEPWRETLELKAVQDVAAARFNYPSPEFPNYRTYVNKPERQMGVRDSHGEFLFPDVVVAEMPGLTVRLLGEVETLRSLRDETLVEKWRGFGGLGAFYLFVPLQKTGEVAALVRRLKIPVVGVRGWRYIAGQDVIDVIDAP